MSCGFCFIFCSARASSESAAFHLYHPWCTKTICMVSWVYYPHCILFFTCIVNIYSILHNHPIITHKIITIIIILIGINCVKISNLFLMSIIQIFFIFSWLTRGWLLGSSVTEEIRATIIDWLIQVCLLIQLNTHRGLKHASRKGNFICAYFAL